jgi:hypothetical protein
LDQKQKCDLQLLLSQKLNHPDYPHMVKGLPGMQVAHDTLKRRNAVGVLVGGLSEAAWNLRRTPEELFAHKDVDVLVIDPNFGLEEAFEGGIDWWLPRRERITFRGDGTTGDVTQTWYENGSGVTLNFGLNANELHEPGLYIMNPDQVVRMRMAEAEASVAFHPDDEVWERFRSIVERRMGKILTSCVKGWFRRPSSRSITIESFSHDVVNAIRKAAA